MASNLLTLQSFCLGFSANRYLNYFQRQAPSNPRSHPLISRRSTLAHNLKLNSVCRAATDGVPSELIEDSKFVPLNADDPRYGPPALLLLGFELEEAVKIQQLLKELDGEFLKVIYCTEDMIAHSLWQAIHTEQSNLETVKIAKSLPRICFLSGLSGEEMMMFIDAFPETAVIAQKEYPHSPILLRGLEPAVFAALVPNSANKLLQEVIEEIMGDHEMLSARQSQSP